MTHRYKALMAYLCLLLLWTSPVYAEAGYEELIDEVEILVILEDAKGLAGLLDKLAYCLQVTLKQRARSKAPGLTPRVILDKFKTMQMIDVHLPTTDGRNLVMPRYTQPEKDLQLLLHQLNLDLPDQRPPLGWKC